MSTNTCYPKRLYICKVSLHRRKIGTHLAKALTPNQEGGNLRTDRELATLAGESMTGAIAVVLREFLKRERRERSLESRMQELQTIV